MKKVTDEELILYFEKDLSKSRMKEIESELEKNKKLRDRYLAFNQMEDDILDDINKNYEIPEEFHQQLSTALSSKLSKNTVKQENKLLDYLRKFSPLSLISGSLISGAAITSFLMMIFAPVLTTTNLVRGPETEITFPKDWSVGQDVLFSATLNSKKHFKSLDDREIRVGTNIIFTFIPTRNITAKIQLLDSEGNISVLYNKIDMKKGSTFTTASLEITKPTGKDKLQIIEDGKIIFESILNIID